MSKKTALERLEERALYLQQALENIGEFRRESQGIWGEFGGGPSQVVCPWDDIQTRLKKEFRQAEKEFMLYRRKRFIRSPETEPWIVENWESDFRRKIVWSPLIKNVVGYTRVSTKAQVSGYGLTRQREYIESYCQIAGYRLVGMTEDAGISGMVGMDKRPGLAAAIRHITSGSADTLLVEDPSRFTRESESGLTALADIMDVRGGLLFGIDTSYIMVPNFL